MSCFVYRKGTIFQANHNGLGYLGIYQVVVLYTAKVRFFKQITTIGIASCRTYLLFCIPQRYDFSSKSQRRRRNRHRRFVVLYTAKVRFFKQITTVFIVLRLRLLLFCIPQRYDFSSKSQHWWKAYQGDIGCFVYRKGTIFQANHNCDRFF